MNQKEIEAEQVNTKVKRKKTRNPSSIGRGANAIITILLGLLAFICVFPFIFVIIISLSSEASIIENGFRLIPEDWSFDAYKYLWEMRDVIFRAYGVTIIVTVVGTLLSVTMISLFAYAISRPQFSYRKAFTFLAFFTMLFSGGMVPFYIVMTQVLELKDTLWALILPLAMNSFYIIVMRSFFKQSVPEAILESARIDGAGEFKIFRKIVMPLAIPGVATIALFNSLAYWNDWYNAMLFIEDPSLLPLQSVLMKIQSSMDFMRENATLLNLSMSTANLPDESAKMAMVVISTLPIALSYPFFQKYFIQGLTVGGVKE